MIGQGSPFSRRRWYVALTRPGWLWHSATTMVLLCCATIGIAAESNVRLRIAWGGGSECRWHGAVRVSKGALSELQPLGIDADEPGSIWIDPSEPGGAVIVRERSPRAYDGIDLLVTAELDATLTIELEAMDPPPAGDGRRPAEAPTKSVEISLQELISESHKTQLDSRGNRLLVMRAPDDRLRVRFERDNLVFAPREKFNLEITPHLLGLPAGTPIRVRAQLAAVHLEGTPRDRLWTNEFDSLTPDPMEPAEAHPVEVKLPDVEGVYDLVIAAINTRLSERLLWKKPLAERKVQLVVLDERRPVDASQQPTMSKVLEIDPANPRWYDRLSNLPLLPGQRPGPLGSGDAVRWEHPKFGALIQLGRAGVARNTAANDTSWESYPLPISEPGQPHILEVEYPSDVPQMLGISLVEPNAAGAVMPIGLDSGVHISTEEADEAPRLLKHRVVFWPRTKSPLLLVTNLGAHSTAVYGKIRVLGFTRSQFAMLPLGQKSTSHIALPRSPISKALASDGESSAGANFTGRQRLLAAYLDRPLFVENFSAPEAMDLFSRRSLDDWATFYLGSQRLVEYLNHVGYNALVMSVLADGSTIYPSSHLQPTPKHDTGVFFATGQDPLRKDVLELVFRMFDREGLILVPALQFAAPLAELEALRREDPSEVVGIEMIGADGRSWTERASSNEGLAPYYNPLNRRVQEAMLTVVRELAERYQEHPSFGGIAVQLTADGYAQLPGADWGYDDDTVARFIEATDVNARDAKLLSANGENRFVVRAELLGGRLRDAWLDWRAEELTSFHRRLGEAAGGELILLGASLFESANAKRGLRPSLPRRTKVDDILLESGLRPQSHPAGSGVALVRPWRIGPTEPLNACATDIELNLAQDADQLFEATGGGAAAQLYHPPLQTRLESFDEQSPFGKANTYTWLVSQLSPAEIRNRKRFVHAIAMQDAQSIIDGGWMMPLGQEESLADLISTYRQLPPVAFTTLPKDAEPVTMRMLSADGQTYLYFANDSPWHVRLEMSIDVPAGTRVERIGPARKLPPLVREGSKGASWTLDLQPYDLLAVRFAAPTVRLTNPRVVLDESVRLALSKRIGDLGARVGALANPPPLPVLANPGFEAVQQGGQIPGWIVTPTANTSAVLDELHKGGKHALRLASKGPRAIVRSDVLDSPATGRLSVALWLKIADKAQQPIVRLAIEGRVDGTDYYRYAAVGGVGRNQVPLTEDWAQYIYQVDDLPTNGLKNLRVRFDLMGAGEVWVDDVQVYDLSFAENERVELSKLISLAEYKRSVGQYAGCLQLLDGYWPRFLEEHVPLALGPGPIARRPLPQRMPVPAAPQPAAEEEPKKPGVFDRLKGFVPRFSGN